MRVESRDEVAGSAKRGLLYITFAKICFLGAGLALQMLLPRALGSRELFGSWTLLLYWISGINNVIVTGTIQAVSHFSRQGDQAVEHAKATALRMQILLGGGATLLVLLGAPLIARFEEDPSLIPLLRLSSCIVLCYSIYAVFVGAANGQKKFHKQAGLDILFSTLRTGLVLMLAWLFHQVFASVIGFIGAAVIITLVSIGWVGWPKKAREPSQVSVLSMLRFIAWLLLYLFALNQLMFIDGYLLKRICTQAFSSALQIPVTAVKEGVDSLIGVYGAAQNLARLPYQLMIAATFVIFPLLSKASLKQNPERTKAYISATLRYSLIVVGAMVVGLGVRPQATLRLLYPTGYETGDMAFRFLLITYVLFSLLSVVGTVLNSLGRIYITAFLALITLLITAASVCLCINNNLPALSFLQEIPGSVGTLEAAAKGMVIGMSVGLSLFLFALWKQVGVTFSGLSLLRVGMASLLSLFVGWFWKAPGTPGFFGSKVGTILCALLSVIIYTVILLISREFSLKEVLQLRHARKEEPTDATASRSQESDHPSA